MATENGANPPHLLPYRAILEHLMPGNDKPFSQACENNKAAIFEQLRFHFARLGKVLEIASGTGQHAVHFAAGLPHLQWQSSDLAENLPGIQAWTEEANLQNLLPPVCLDVRRRPWPVQKIDAVYAANCAHIMHWPVVGEMFKGISQVLDADGLFVLYGPFNYVGRFTSASNEAFDSHLKAGDAGMGIRAYEALEKLANEVGLLLIADHAMPANNRLLVWQRV